jgi:Cytidylate kinase-like family
MFSRPSRVAAVPDAINDRLRRDVLWSLRYARSTVEPDLEATMSIIVMSIEPYAVPQSFLNDLARALNLDLVDLRAFERDIAERINVGPLDTVIDLVAPRPGSTNHWGMRLPGLATRLRELTLETALLQNVLVVGWSAAAILHPLPHVATVCLRASESYRASAVQRRMHYPLFGTAQIELTSTDELIDNFVSRVLHTDWRRREYFDLTLDAERVSASARIEIVGRLAQDSRCTQTTTTLRAVNDLLLDLEH